MKTLRLLTLNAVMFFAVFAISSCSSPEKKIAGTWITESVSASVDSTKANLAGIDANIASLQTMKYTLNDDHSMTLDIDGYTSNAFWTYNSEDGKLSYRFDAQFEDEYELGKLEGDKIIYTSSVKHGTITSVHVKE